MSDKTIRIISIPSAADYNSLRVYYMYRQRPKRTRVIVYLCLASLALLAISETVFAMFFLRISGLLGMLAVAGIYARIVVEARPLDKNVKGFMNIRQEVELTEDGFTVEWKGYEPLACSWSEVYRTVESDSHFYLFTEPEFAVILPKLDMKEATEKRIRDLLERHTELISEVSGWKARKII